MRQKETNMNSKSMNATCKKKEIIRILYKIKSSIYDAHLKMYRQNT